MSRLLAADLHLTDNPRDRHRLGILRWLATTALNRGCDQIVLLGDITDAKDHHSGRFVNWLANEMFTMAESGIPIEWLRGNHDGVDPDLPFFRFVQQGTRDGVRYIVEPMIAQHVLWLPSTRDWQADWALWLPRLSEVGLVFAHVTFDGCLSENGTRMQGGAPPGVFRDFSGKVWSGDIHVPQRVGANIEYIGAPYRIRFGDTFTPRCVILHEDGTTENLRYPCPLKATVTVRRLEDVDRYLLHRDDQVKIRVLLTRAEYPDWPALRAKLRQHAEAKGWDLCGGIELAAVDPLPQPATPAETAQASSPGALVADYGRRNRFDKEMVELGLGLLQEAMGG